MRRKIFPGRKKSEILRLPLEAVFTREHALALGFTAGAATRVRHCFQAEAEFCKTSPSTDWSICVITMADWGKVTAIDVLKTPNIAQTSLALIEAVLQDLGLKLKPPQVR